MGKVKIVLFQFCYECHQLAVIAGNFSIERVDPEGSRNVAVIKSDQVLQQRLRRKGSIEPEMVRVLQERDAFLHELEKPAEIAEAVVWRELIESQRMRKE